MKITSSKLDDLYQAREDYDKELNELKERSELNSRAWRKAIDDAETAVERQVSDLIGRTSLNLEIRASQNWKDNWRITVNAERSAGALRWRFDVELDENGEVVKDTGSWSGLQAITEDELNELEESVRILRVLNNINWKDILSQDTVNYQDYTDSELENQLRDKRNNRPKFEDEILTARLNDLVGQNIAIRLSKDMYFKGEVGILLTGVSDKFIKGYIFPWNYIDEDYGARFTSNAKGDTYADKLRNHVGEVRRTSRDNIVLVNDELDEANLN